MCVCVCVRSCPSILCGWPSGNSLVSSLFVGVRGNVISVMGALFLHARLYSCQKPPSLTPQRELPPAGVTTCVCVCVCVELPEQSPRVAQW